MRAGRGAARRPGDVAEIVVSWVLGGLAVLLAGAAVLTGLAAHAEGVRRADTESAERTRVTAVLLGPGDPALTSDPAASTAHRAPATWTTPDGVEHTGTLLVWRSAEAGVTVPVWVDGDGRVVPAPATRTSGLVGAVTTAVLLLALGGGLLVGTWRLVRRATLAVNARAWGEEWRRVAPEWTGRPA